MIVTLEEMKQYLRTDYADDDDFITSLIEGAEKLCMDVARVNREVFEENAATTRIAVLYAVAYLYEHREDADHNQLTLTVRALLFGIRKEGF